MLLLGKGFRDYLLNSHFFQLLDISINLIIQAFDYFSDHREGLLNTSQGLSKIGSERSMVGYHCSKLTHIGMLLQKFL